jgi:tetratricopeptide (TPR) repeat protein
MTPAAKPSTMKSEGNLRRKVASVILRAEKHLKKTEYALAKGQLQSVLVSDPNHVGALEVLARCLWKSEDFVGLESVTTRLTELNPFEPGYHSLRGMALRALGRYGEAARALARDPQASAQLLDLEAFQATLVKDLISSDPLFAASYSRNPEKALEERGFHFVQQESALAWVAANTPTVRTYSRPS